MTTKPNDQAPAGARGDPAPSGAGARRDHVEVAEAFARLAQQLHGQGSVEETADAVARFALRALDCDYAGIALLVAGRPKMAAVTVPALADTYQAQVDANRGPFLLALQQRRAVTVADTSREPRWPEWAAIAVSLGIRSSLHVPLSLRPQSALVGVLACYRSSPRVFDSDDEAVARILAQHASIAIASARQDASMAEAVDARMVVGQAMGILMERFDLDADQAFTVLRRYSQNNNFKLRDVAQRLVDTRKLPAGRPPRAATAGHQVRTVQPK